MAESLLPSAANVEDGEADEGRQMDAKDAGAETENVPKVGGGGIFNFASPPPLGKCEVLVHAIDARDLAPRDSNNSSDPVVKVYCAFCTRASLAAPSFSVLLYADLAARCASQSALCSSRREAAH